MADCGGSDAPAPDPRMGEAANRQIALSEKRYADYMAPGGDSEFTRGLANEALGISRSTAQRSNALSDYQLENMKFNDNRYRNTAIPFEDRLLEDVNRFDSQGYKDEQVGMAMADVQQGFSGATEQQARGLARMGINPNSGRSQAAANEMSYKQASAMASAASKTRMAADQIGLSSKMSMYGGMKGLAGLGNANASLAQGSMGMGLNAGGAISGGANNYLNAGNSAFGASMGGMSSGISGLGQYNQLQQGAVAANNANDPMGTIVGAAAGAGMAYLTGGASAMGAAAGKAGTGIFSDRRLKTDIKAVGKLDSGLTVYTYRYKAGGPVLMGVMADEVEHLRPDAFIANALGDFAAVDYSQL